MRKMMMILLAVTLIFTVGAVAYAHGPGYEGKGGGHMMGGGYGNHMMGGGYGGHMMGGGHGNHMMGYGRGGYMIDRGGARYEDNQKFLDETKDIRRELHNKRFEYMELSRNPDTSGDTLAALEKEIFGLEDKIRDKAPRSAMGRAGGHCW